MRSEEQCRCVLGFRGLRISIRANDPAPLHWLEEFVSPHLRQDTEAVSKRGIRVVIDADRYADMLAEGDDCGAHQIDCFTMDGQFQRHTLWRDGRQGRLIHLEEARALLALPLDDGAIELIAQADGKAMRVALMRVVRELTTLWALHCGDLFMHSAAAAHRGPAVVIAGGKSAGKTTMLLHALRQPRAQFLSNDRVLVELGPQGPIARGMPTIVKVRPQCLQHIPGLSEPGQEHPLRHYLTIQECVQGSDLIEPPKRHPASMSPAQFCRWLDVEAVAEAPLGTVVFPRVDPEVDGFTVRPLSVSEAAGRLAASLFSPGDAGPLSEAFRPAWDDGFPSRNVTFQACHKLAELCPCHECRVGPDAYQSDEVWSAIAASAVGEV